MQKEFSARLAWAAGLGLVLFVALVSGGLWQFQKHLVPMPDRYPHARPENPLHETEFEAGQIRAQIEGAGYAKLNSYGWVDKEKGLVHVPIQEAMKMLVDERKPKP